MGNLLACFGGPKKGGQRKPSLTGKLVCESHEPWPEGKGHVERVDTVSIVAGGRSCSECVESASFREANGDHLADNPEQVDLKVSNQPTSKSPKKVGFSSPKKKVTFDMNVQTYETVEVCEHLSLSENEEEGDDDIEGEKKKEKAEGVSVYPLNHRYQNCASSDEENSEEDEEDDDHDDFDECDEGEDDELVCDDIVQEEESFHAYFAKKLDEGFHKPKEGENSYPDSECAPSLQLKPHLLTNPKARDRSKYVLPVLNPVENLSQWKEMKVGKLTPKHSMKENFRKQLEPKVFMSSAHTTTNGKIRKSPNSSLCSDKTTKSEVSVDASLSSWLTPPRNKDSYSPQGSYSRSNTPMSFDDRPILGALTVDDIKQANSKSPSPRKSPGKSHEETPIVGSVGRYWSPRDETACSGLSSIKGIPNTTSKYSEDRQVNWHSTPFEVRLHRVLSKGSTGRNVHCSPAVC